jgi:8-amino-7-oxononanoate synthase
MLIDHLTRQLEMREQQSLRRCRSIVETPWSTRVRITHFARGQQDVLAFCSNDYLGMAGDLRLRTALAEGVQRWGAGSAASHVVSGHGRAHEDLEMELSDWFAPCIPNAKALTFSTGYMANMALMTALGDASVTIHADRLNHASLVDGGLLAKGDMRRYAHGRLDVLAGQLARSRSPIKLIVTDGVFSMDGDVAALRELLDLAETHDAWLVVDDAHGCGVLGEQGRGSLSHHAVSSRRLILMGTLGKAMGVSGAFVVADPVIVDWLGQVGRPYLYSTATPPALAHAAQASIALIRGSFGDQRRLKLRALIGSLRDGLRALLAAPGAPAWHLLPSETPIQPLVVGDVETALMLSAILMNAGIWVPAIRPPTVPAGTARLRFTLSATHQLEDIEELLHALRRAIPRFA